MFAIEHPELIHFLWAMQMLQEIYGIDVYLLDQLLKNRIPENGKILDAGCGSGRNIHFLMQKGFNVTAFDSSESAIQKLKEIYPEKAQCFFHSSIENFNSGKQFDFIICNAVLHFAKSHSHFQMMFEKLQTLLSHSGILFIRMTSKIGLPYSPVEVENGVYLLRDDSQRYLITREQIADITAEHNLTLIEPVKSVVVEGLRSMCVLVLGR